MLIFESSAIVSQFSIYSKNSFAETIPSWLMSQKKTPWKNYLVSNRFFVAILHKNDKNLTNSDIFYLPCLRLLGMFDKNATTDRI
jgi:hypothetical protein